MSSERCVYVDEATGRKCSQMKGCFLMIDAVAAREATECDDGHELGPSTLVTINIQHALTSDKPLSSISSFYRLIFTFVAKRELYEKICTALASS